METELQTPILPECEKLHLGNLVMWPKLRTPENVDGMFFVPQYRAIADELVRVHSEGLDGGRLDVDTACRQLVTRFEAAGTLDRFGGTELTGEASLQALVMSLPFDVNPEVVPDAWRATAERLRVAARRRKLMAFARQLQEAAGRDDVTDEQLDRMRESFFEAGGKCGELDVSKKDAIKSCMTRLDLMIRTHSYVTGLTSGYDHLDDMLGGLRPGTFTVIGARPSMGKTALGLNLAWRVAERMPEDAAGDVLFVTAEMGVPQLMERLICTLSEVGVRKSVKRGMRKGEIQKVREAILKLKRGRLEFMDANGVDVDAVAAHLRQRHRQRPIALMVVDYLQLMRCRRMEDQGRYAVVSEVSRVLTCTAHELGVPLVALAQLSRESAKSKNKVPGLTDLRESGQIEQDADAVLLLHRPDYYEQKEDPEVRITKEQYQAQVIVAKNREGSTGMVVLTWEPDIQRFSPLTTTDNEDN